MKKKTSPQKALSLQELHERYAFEAEFLPNELRLVVHYKRGELLLSLPPDAHLGRFLRIQDDLKEDAAQSMWVSYLSGQKAESGRSGFLRQECGVKGRPGWRKRGRLLSQLNEEEVRELQDKTDFEPDAQAEWK